jgi:predicted nucleotidyltransferase
MPDSPIPAMKAVARLLDQWDGRYAFLGGSVVSLLVDHSELIEVRPTDDVDVVVEVLSHLDYTELEHRLRGVGFTNDIREGAPRCRWVLENLTVDIMPTKGELQGLNTAWFQEALESAVEIEEPGALRKVVSPVGFLATKHAAHRDRGQGDFYGSADLEDIITVIDGREKIVREIAESDTPLRSYVVGSIAALSADSDFQDALPGLLASDEAGQARLPGLRTKLEQISDLG